jgi:hypothetical protein
MTHTNQDIATEGAVAPIINANIVEMIALIDELIGIIVSENRQLSNSVPASLSQSIAHKARLGTKLEEFVEAVRSGQIVIAWAAPRLREQLTLSVAQLDATMVENMYRLRAAIDATRGRVDAVMRAIREQGESEGAYRANGRMLTMPSLAALTSGRLA